MLSAASARGGFCFPIEIKIQSLNFRLENVTIGAAQDAGIYLFTAHVRNQAAPRPTVDRLRSMVALIWFVVDFRAKDKPPHATQYAAETTQARGRFVLSGEYLLIRVLINPDLIYLYILIVAQGVRKFYLEHLPG